MKVWFNPNNDGFYLQQWYPVQPPGTIEITLEKHAELMNLQNNGLIISHDKNGYPIAIQPDEQEPNEEELIDAAESEKSRLRSVADSEIEWRQDAVDAEIATEDESAALVEWKKYRVLLMRVDTAAPEWPTPPAVQAR